jgi:plastocyanin
MRRAAAAAVLAVAMIAAAPASARVDPGTGSGSPSNCTWHKHTKQVVRHVRRHGRLRRVVRTRSWWTCDPIPTGRVSVSAYEWHFVLSRPTVSGGDLIVELDNRGQDDHNLNIVPVDGTDPLVSFYAAKPGERSSQRFSLPPGTYKLYCSLPEHEARGMSATLEVTP